MLLRYAFFAGAAEEHDTGRYDFRDVSNGAHVAAFPAQIHVTCVLVVECEPTDAGAELDLTVHVVAPPVQDGRDAARIETKFRACPPRRGSMPRYEYVPIELQFTAPRGGAYQIQVDCAERLWYTGFYRVEASGRDRTRPRG